MVRRLILEADARSYLLLAVIGIGTLYQNIRCLAFAKHGPGGILRHIGGEDRGAFRSLEGELFPRAPVSFLPRGLQLWRVFTHLGGLPKPPTLWRIPGLYRCPIMNRHFVLPLLLLTSALAAAADAPIPPVPDKQPAPSGEQSRAAGVQMLIPGFTVDELPVDLTSLNSIEYAADGRLFAGGYDGRFHLLRDTNGDGLEDRAITFSPETSASYPLGMAVKDGDLYVVLSNEIIRWRDTDGDGIPDLRETVVKGFDDPELVSAPYLNHRRVDSSLGLAIAPDGTIYSTMGNAGYDNAYWHDKEHVAHYSPERRRGCLLRISPDGKVTQLHSGLRYVLSLQFNKLGDLFATDQEGATWVPNGNPFDELLYLPLDNGRHFGFPPRHPHWLPDVIDEPSVFDYAPQHESTCGFRFNGPSPGRGRFGPEWWSDDAFVTGESRGKLWRTKLARTAAGYVAQTQLFARLGVLPVDCTISPQGDLVVCCHTGQPDWGNGPKGAGRIFKIRYSEQSVPLPVLAYPQSETETLIAFDRPLDPKTWKDAATRASMETGHYVSAADRLETLHPPYAVVKMQLTQPRSPLSVKSARLSDDCRNLILETSPNNAASNTAIAITGNNNSPSLDMASDLSGIFAEWTSAPGTPSRNYFAWLPHPDFAAARQFTRGSSNHENFWRIITERGKLVMKGQLDLWQMLIPATQPLSTLDYVPEPETVTVTFKSDAPIELSAPGTDVERVSDTESRLTVSGPRQNVWPAFTLTVATPVLALDVSLDQP